MAFAGATQLFFKALNKSGVQFPATKAEIIQKVGDLKIQVTDDTYAKVADIVSNIAVSEFPNGAAFACGYIASVYVGACKEMTGK
jgi:hypothetical protein